MNSIPLHSVHSLIHHDHNSRPYPPSNPIHLHQPSSSQPSFHNSQKRSLPPQQSPTEPAPRPTKRSRKAINCEPCRSSKLKCDRGRPCSGCVLRNTVSQCYSDAPGDVVEGNPGAPPSRPPIEDFSHSRVDPRAELLRIRNSLLVIEGHINRTTPGGPTTSSGHHSTTLPPISHLADYAPRTLSLAPVLAEDAPPKPSDTGFFTGATSIAGHLFTLRHNERGVGPSEGDETDQSSTSEALLGRLEDLSSPPVHHVAELFQHLPDVSIIDTLIDNYFTSSVWIHKHLHEKAFRSTWDRFKLNPSAQSRGHITLATVFCLLAISTQYLQPVDPIITSVPYTQMELGDYYFSIAQTAYTRHRLETKALCMDLIEFLLLKVHYLNISKRDCEAIWTVRGQLLSFGTAMGLHRDPGKWKMSAELMERRRWAWWNTLMTDRWQSFIYGRPIGIANHHFDTQYPMPDNDDLSVRASDNPDLPYLHAFRLVSVMGDILNDSQSVRAVPYERVLANDRALQHLLDTFPPDMAADYFRIARNLAFDVATGRRLAAQTIIGRASLLHVRFALHRPYTNPEYDKSEEDSPANKSLELGVTAANDALQVLTQAHPDYVTNPKLAVPGHLSWGSFHGFAAAMFFISQLIWRPDEPGNNHYKYNIKRALNGFAEVKGTILLAAKAWSVVTALGPIWNDEANMDEERKTEVLAQARKLAVPCHDSPIYPTARTVTSESPSNASANIRGNNTRTYGSATASPIDPISPSGSGMSHANTSGMSQSNLVNGNGNPHDARSGHQTQQHYRVENPSTLNGSNHAMGVGANSNGGLMVGPPLPMHVNGNSMHGGGGGDGQHQHQQQHMNGSGYGGHTMYSNGVQPNATPPDQYFESLPFTTNGDEGLWSASLGLYQTGDWTNILSGMIRPGV